MRTSSLIFLNAATSWIAVLAQGVVRFFLVPFLLGVLDRDGYGLILLMSTLISFSRLADLGLRGAMGRAMAEEAGKGNREGINQIASSGMAVYLLISLLVAGGVAFAAAPIARLLNVPEQLWSTSIWLLRGYASVILVISFVMPVFSSAIIAQHRFDIVNNINTAGGILEGVLVFTCLSLWGGSLLLWAVVMVVVHFLRLVLLWLFTCRLNPTFHLARRHVRFRQIRDLMSMSGYMLSFQLTRQLSTKSDPVVISSYLGPAMVPLYGPPTGLMNMVRPLVGAMANQLYPLATSYHVQGNTRNLQSVLTRGTLYTMLMGVPVVAMAFVFAEPIMHVWLGGHLGPDTVTAAHVLMGWALIELMQYAAGTQWPVLLGMKRLKFLFWSTLPPALLNLGVSIFLTGYTSLGVMGVVYPTVAIWILRRPIVTVLTARAVGLKPGQYFMESYCRPILVLVLLVGFCYLFRLWVDTWSWTILIGSAAGVGLFWALLVWMIGFTTSDRASFRSLLKRIYLKAIQQIGRK